MSFRETLTMHALGWGNGYAEIVRDEKDRATALWPIDPTRVQIKRNDRHEIIYTVAPIAGGDELRFESHNMFHLHGLGFDGLTGYSVAHLARESIGAALGAQQTGAALFGNASMPSGVLETAMGGMSEERYKNLKEGWSKVHEGPANAHRIAVLGQGITFKPIAISHKDSQWIEAREFMVSELARWLRIPPHKIAHMRDATFSNIESQAREYIGDTLQPWFVRWESEILRKLIPAKNLFAEHLADGLLRGDTKGRFEAYATAVNAGWMSRNEVREKENMNPVAGLDEFLEPLNTAPVEADPLRQVKGDDRPLRPVC